MIPVFPDFKNIELSDKNEVASFVSELKPYADFNFTNLWSWNTLETRKLSILNNNLVIQFSDYLDNSTFLSFIGDNKLDDTLKCLIEFSKSANADHSLKFITEETVKNVLGKDIMVEEDTRNHDYVFSPELLATNPGKPFKSKRRAIQKFMNENPSIEFVTTNTLNDHLIREIFELVEQWGKNKHDQGKNCDLVFETLALNRLLRSTEHFNLLISLLYVDGKLSGFGIDEIVNNKHAISHFIKADVRYSGVYEYLNYEIAKILLERGVTEWNWEQDLGIEGLKQIKLSYRPITFFKKFKITF